MSDVAAPLQSIIKRLAGTDIVGPAAKRAQRFTDASDELVVLADCSGSMLDFIGSQGISKFEHLQIALEDVMLAWPRIKILAFASTFREIANAKDLPRAGLGGGTNLAGAIEYAAKWRPRKTIIISDGLPDSEAEAIAAAQKITGAVDTIYCGPDAHPAVAFLRKLSREAAGIHFTWEGGRTSIAQTIRGLLPSPE
jgi:hypothetical protein